MALFFSDGAKTPLMDDGMSAVMRRRMNELWGLGFLVLAIGLGAALWTYDVTDPSPFSATTAPPRNLLGDPGAIFADTFMRHVGLGAWGLVALFGVWALRFVLHIGEERIWARLLLWLPSLIIATVFASTHAVYEGWQLAQTGLGGRLGDTGARLLLNAIPLPDLAALRLVSLALGAALVVVGGAALGVTLGEAGRLLAWLSRSLRQTAGLVTRKGMALGAAGAAGAAAARARLAARRAAARLGSGGDDVAAPETRRTPRIARPAHDEEVIDADLDPAPTDAAGPARSWRDRLRGISLPAVSLPSLSVPGLKRRQEPELRLERVHGADPADLAAEEALGRARAAASAAPRDAQALDAPDDDRALRAVFDRLSAEGEFTETVAGEDAWDAAPDEPARPAVERQLKPPRRSRRAEQELQPSLAFETDAPPAHELPPLALLQKPVKVVHSQTPDLALEENARMLETVLEDYGVKGEIVAVRPGPVVTLYELEPAPGLKASRVIGLADDIARSMSALAARVSTVPGRSIIGIELPNAEREKVWLRDVFERREYGDARFPLALALGKDISGAPVVANLAKMPHLLIAGTTGSGKSVAINTMILSLLYRLSPDECRLIMIDPKMLELSVYDNIPHLLAPVVTDPKKAIVALKWAVAEMEERYRKMSKLGVRNIDGYNARVRAALDAGEDFSRTVQTGFDEATGEPIYETETFEPREMPYIVVIVDEMADLMMVAGKEIEACIQRLAQMARASGIHLIMATQRPSVDVITGTIKSNFPTRISFQVTSKIDSRTILGEQGAEQLLGMGDMLFMEGGGRILRVHGPFVSDEEVEEVVAHLQTQGMPDYVGEVTEGVDDEAGRAVDEKLGLAAAGSSDDELYDMAVAIVARDRKCSTSYIQRKLAIGYNKAARLVERMEDEGVVTPANSVGKREILVEER